MVPTAASEGTQRISLPWEGLNYEDTIENIHDAVGCSDIKRKPQLSYKLSTATQKSAAVSLAKESDYDGLLEDVAAAETKLNKSWRNGDRWQYVSVSILVPDNVSLSMSIQDHKF
jgi:hypothetical protein